MVAAGPEGAHRITVRSAFHTCTGKRDLLPSTSALPDYPAHLRPPFDAAWGIRENWVGIGFGLERLTMAATHETSMAKVGRSLSYLDGIRLRL